MASVYRCVVLEVVVLSILCGEHLANSVITDVSLFGGPTSDRGTVEIRQDSGAWETTCGTNLGINDVIVICRQLGFIGASRAITNTPYRQNSTPQSGLDCNGGEADLSQCQLFENPNCSTAGSATCHGEGYLGCFEDLRVDRVLPGDSLVDDPVMTISYCIQFCNESISGNYIHAGVENGKECFCGEARDDYTRLGTGTDSDCQSPCSGDNTDTCGGSGYIAVYTINTPSPTTPIVSSTGSDETTPTRRETSETPPSSVMTTMSQPKTVPPPNGDNNIGLYASSAGGVFAIVVVFIIIVVVVLMKKRSRGKQKDQLRSHDMTVMQPASQNGGQDNLYHDIFQDMNDAGTSNDSQVPVPSAEDDSMYYSSVKDQLSAEGDDTYYSSVKDQKTADKDSTPNNAMSSNRYEGLSETGVVRLSPNDDAAAMYAMPDKQGRKSHGEDFGVLYAKPDKTGNGGDGRASEDFGKLYAMPDKTRGVPEGREDVKVSDLYAMPDKSQGQDQGELKSEHNNGEGSYPLADDDTGLYAMSTAPGHTVNSDDEYGTIMVDNELYAM